MENPPSNEHAGESPKPWWKSGWLWGLALIGVLHVTGMAVHVQAAVQRAVLATGVLRPDLVPEADRPAVAMDFLVRDDGEMAISATSWEGEVVFLNVWATWCAPCLAELPSINALHRELGEDVRFVMITVDEDPDIARRFMASKGYSLPVFTPASRLPEWLHTGAIPTSAVVDRAGRLAVREAGMALYDTDRFKSQLRGLVRESGSEAGRP